MHFASRIVGRLRARRKERREAWELVCDRCGLCCYQKRYRHGRLAIDLATPCPYLDERTRSCKVYEERFRLCADCRKVRLYHALCSGLMPASCAYVRRYRRLGRLITTPVIYDPRERDARNAGRSRR